MSGLFITFEGTEGSGKSTQIEILARRLEDLGFAVRRFREPGSTPIGEEIRHTLKHSAANHAMAPETELLLMNASRAQLVREAIRPALEAGAIVLCDRFYDSTIAYQAHGRGLDLGVVERIIKFAVGPTRPDLTLLLTIPVQVSESRRQSRLLHGMEKLRDRMEESDRAFFERVESAYANLAADAPRRIKPIDATVTIEEVSSAIWRAVEPLIRKLSPSPNPPTVGRDSVEP